MKKFKKLEDLLREPKNSHFRSRKSKKEWVTSSQTLLSRLVKPAIQLVAQTSQVMIGSKKARHLVIATLLALGVGGGTLTTSHFVLAAPPASGTVNWTPQNDIATLSNGEVVTYLSLDSSDPVYCLAMGVPLNNPSTQAQQDAMNAIWAKLTETQKAVINNIAYLANKAGAATNRTIYTAARLGIWHQLFVYGVASEDATPSMIVSFGPDSSGVTVATVQTEFDGLINQAQALTSKPSFDGQTVKLVVGVPKTITDTNGVLSTFPFIKSNVAGLSETVSGNTLTLNPTSAVKAGSTSNAIQFRNATSKQYPNGLPRFVYSTNGDSSGNASQPVIAATDPSAEVASLNVNVTLDGSLKIVKKQTAQDAHQGSGNIAGAKFDVTLYQADGTTVDTGIDGTFDTLDAGGAKNGSISFSKGVAHNVTTGKDGSITIKDFSAVGDVYKVTEVAVPAPYTLGHSDSTGKLVNTPITGKITEDSTTGTAQAVFTDNKQVGGIKFHKAGLYNGANLLNNLYQFNGTVMGVKDAAGNVVAQATLDAKGEGSTTDNPLSSPLVIGQKYTAFEITAGAGFVNTFAPKEVTFTYKGANQVIDWEDVSGTNTEVTGEIEIDKTVKDATTLGNKQNTQGANFTIFYRSDVKDATGQILHKAGDKLNLADGLKGKPITITSGTQDEAAFSETGDVTVRLSNQNKVIISGIPAGEWMVQETQAGYGESLNSTKYNFDVKKKDEKTAIINVKQDLPNQALRWNAMFTKVLEQNHSLTGLNDAQFQLVAQDANTKAAFKAYGFEGKGDVATSGTTVGGNGFTSDGLTAFYNVPLGTELDANGFIARYQLKEIVTPKGTKTIVPINIDVTANVNQSGAIQSYTYKFYWSDTKQVIHEETYSAATLIDDKVLTVRPNLGMIADEVITPPTITTTASDAADKDSTLGVGLASINDNAVVANLSPNTDYTMKGEAVHSEDGTPKLDKDGNPITATVSFTTDLRGNAIVPLKTPDFDTTADQGKKYTMLETVTDKNGTVVVKEDHWKNNPAQTVSVTKVEGATQVKSATVPLGSKVQVVDTYHYEGLVPGQSYTVKISNASVNHTNQLIPVEGQVTFAPTKAEGEIDVPVTLDSLSVYGSELTFVNEALYLGTDTTQQPILNNNNPKDEKETVSTPTLQPHKFETKGATDNLTNNTFLQDDSEIAKGFKLTGDAKDTTTKETEATFKAEVEKTAKDAHVDEVKNNQTTNGNNTLVKIGQVIPYQLWLDTTPFDQTALLTKLGLVDDYDERYLTPDLASVKVWDASGEFLAPSDYVVTNVDGKVQILLNHFKESTLAKGKTVKVLDMPFGQYYKASISMTVKAGTPDHTDILNVASQVVEGLNPDGTPLKGLTIKTETRVNEVTNPAVAAPKKVVKPEVKAPTPKAIAHKVVNIFLPKTGDSKSILTAVGAWFVTVSLVVGAVLNERKRHTLMAGINKFKRYIKF
ncbi:VaFE repeat-containing surface-anchored protein [Lactococcus kimchii]|uniref:VaFE repeat-containing surface-anchored protein n=1 Tax=Lactococcus sp. S-13 TaxID=2507158 RepID=UPI001022E625|nr:VaFE repeat-containing surface-anchored protein [Lactococcus sp. S-13]RZI47897.1 hypothetical protein EQJ87_10780 [Lactococcus sp. S-13]